MAFLGIGGKKTEAQRIRAERIARARENLESSREDLAQIPWGSDAEREIAQRERDETLQVVRNMRVSGRALEREWEALVEGEETKVKVTEAQTNAALLRRHLKG